MNLEKYTSGRRSHALKNGNLGYQKIQFTRGGFGQDSVRFVKDTASKSCQRDNEYLFESGEADIVETYYTSHQPGGDPMQAGSLPYSRSWCCANPAKILDVSPIKAATVSTASSFHDFEGQYSLSRDLLLQQQLHQNLEEPLLPKIYPRQQRKNTSVGPWPKVEHYSDENIILVQSLKSSEVESLQTLQCTSTRLGDLMAMEPHLGPDIRRSFPIELDVISRTTKPRAAESPQSDEVGAADYPLIRPPEKAEQRSSTFDASSSSAQFVIDSEATSDFYLGGPGGEEEAKFSSGPGNSSHPEAVAGILTSVENSRTDPYEEIDDFGYNEDLDPPTRRCFMGRLLLPCIGRSSTTIPAAAAAAASRGLHMTSDIEVYAFVDEDLEDAHRSVMAKTSEKYLVLDTPSLRDKLLTSLLIGAMMVAVLVLFLYQNVGPGFHFEHVPSHTIYQSYH